MNKCSRGVSRGFCKGLMCELSLEVHARLARAKGKGSLFSERGQQREGRG